MGWCLARGANMQKFYFKIQPDKPFLGITPETVTDGERTLLVNGFWGLSRHINYLGEILMASGIALAVGYPGAIWPWLYPLYYVVLLFPRERDDDRRCAAKYGPLWQEYTSLKKQEVHAALFTTLDMMQYISMGLFHSKVIKSNQLLKNRTKKMRLLLLPFVVVMSLQRISQCCLINIQLRNTGNFNQLQF